MVGEAVGEVVVVGVVVVDLKGGRGVGSERAKWSKRSSKNFNKRKRVREGEKGRLHREDRAILFNKVGGNSDAFTWRHCLEM